jgi:hypothetical protein
MSGTLTLPGGGSTATGLSIDVATAGGSDGNQPDPGYPDGGTGGSAPANPGCGGGGGTQVWIGSTLYAEAAGGGGCGGYGSGDSPSAGGEGGTPAGLDGATGDHEAGSCAGGGGGGGATTVGGGGGGGGGCSASSGGDGAQALGGDGGNGNDSTGGGGGGGGGGWYGGGGGGGGTYDAFEGSSGGGGGGGSSDCTSCTGVSYSSGNLGGGSATISWQQISSSVALGPDPTSLPFGGTLTLTATVTTPSLSGYQPTGTIDFTGPSVPSGCDSVALAAVAGGGSTATCSLAVGDGGATSLPSDEDFSASYGGDGTAASASGGTTVTVDQATTTSEPVTALLESSGGSATTTWSSTDQWALSTTVNGEYAASRPSGTVTFDETATHGSTTLSGPDSACSSTFTAIAQSTDVSCQFSPVIPGATYTFTATYPGSTDFSGTTSPSTTCTPSGCVVPKAVTSTSITLESSSATVTYGQTVTVGGAVTGLPSGDTAATLTYEYQDGTPVECNGGDSGTVNVGSGGTAAACVFTPAVADTSVDAVFNPDAYAGGSASPQDIALSVTRAVTSTAVSAAGAGGYDDVGVRVTVSATVTNTANTGPGPAGTLAFHEDGSTTPLPGCGAVIVTPGSGSSPDRSSASCVAPGRATTGTDTFTATFSPAAAVSADWGSSTSAADSYTTSVDPTSVTVTPTASSVRPVSLAAGDSETVTATVALTSGVVGAGAGTSPEGTVTFSDNGNQISNCAGLSLTGSGTSGSATCTLTAGTAPLLPGTLYLITAQYDPDPATGGSGSDATADPLYILVAGASTTTAVAVDTSGGSDVTGGSVAYGVPLELVASVTSTAATVSEGTVSFTVDGSPGCQNVPVTAGQAVCAVTAGAGALSTAAAYGDASSTFLSSTSTTVSATVTSASTSTSIAVAPDPTDSSDVLVTATVTDTATGSTVAPAGTVDFTGGATCSGVALVTVAGQSTAGCAVASPGAGPTTFSAAFTTAGGDFAGSSGSVSYTVGTCSADFSTLWSAAGGSPLDLGLGSLSSTLDTSTVTLGSVTGGCNPATVIPVTGATLSIYGKTIASSSLSGYLEDASSSGGDPQLCLDGGTLSFPSGWSLPSITLGSSAGGNRICFSVIAASSSSLTVGGVSSAQLQATGITLPFGSPDSALSYTLTLSFAATAPAGSCSAAADQATLSFAPQGSPGSSPYLEASITLGVASGTASACGQVTVGNLFTGGPVSGTFTVSTGTSGSIAGSLTVDALTTAPISLAPGLELYNVAATVSSSSGLSVSACAVLGDPGGSLSLPAAGCSSAVAGLTTAVGVSVSGGYAGGSWTLSLSAATGLSWQPFSSLSFSNLTLSGSVKLTSGAVSFDIEAGTPPSGTTPPAHPLVAWDPASGVAVDLSCLAFAYGMTPSCGSALSLGTPTDPTLVVDGYVSLGSGSESLSAGLAGSIDLRQGTASLALDPSTTSDAITVVDGLTLTLDSLSVSGSVGGGLTVTGAASATVPSVSSTPITVTVTNASGALVIAVSGIDLSGAGIPVQGFFAYASGAVAAYPTGMAAIGSGGAVDLVTGFNAFGVYTLPAGVAAALSAAGLDLTSGSTLQFSGSWDPGATPAFTASITAPSGFPFLKLPDGGSLSSMVLAFSADTLTLDVAGTIPVPDQAAASITLDLTIDTQDGSFSGTVTVSGFHLFGQLVGFAGTLARSASGSITANVQSCQPTAGGCAPGAIAGPFTPFPGVPLQLTDVSFSFGTSGISVSGTATVQSLGSLSVSGSLTSLENWSITVTATQAQAWTPVPGVTLDASLSGTLTDASGVITFVLSATGAGGQSLFTISVGGVTVSVAAVRLGNGTPPSGCSVASAGDLWLCVSGSLSLDLASVSGSVSVTGTFDLTAGSLLLTATLPSLAFASSDGSVTLDGPTLTLSESGGQFQVTGTVPLTAQMPGGGTFTATVTLAFLSGGTFVAGIEADLSQWLGGYGGTVYVYYASGAVSSFPTGDPAIGSVALAPGLDFALTMEIPESAASALKPWVTLTTGVEFVATGNIDFAADAFTFKIEVSALARGGIQIFSTHGVSLVVDDGYVKVQIVGGTAQFGIGMTSTLNLPSIYAGDPASSFDLSGELDVTTTEQITVSLALGTCGGTTGGWVDAFGIPGLTVQCADIEGGINFETDIPTPVASFDGTITSLPSVIANVIGFQEGAPITFAMDLSLTTPMLDVSIGTKNATTPVLEPLAYFGQGSLIEVYYADLYISPQAVTVGQTTYPAGLGLGFQATVAGVQINVLADVGLSPPSIDVDATMSQIDIDTLSLGPVTLIIDASTSSFEFEFQGALSLGPGSEQIGPALSVGGSLAASVDVDVSTSGVSAFIAGDIDVLLGAKLAQSVCYWEGFVPYPCNFQWEYTTLSFTLARTGFSLNQSGITLEADGYSLTFDWDGHVSVSLAHTVPGSTAASGTALVAHAVPIGGASSPAGLTTTAPARLLAAGTAATPSPGPGGVIVGPLPGAATPSGRWSQAASMPGAGAFAASALLRNGEVLVAGGLDAGDAPTASAAVYDPATGQWSAAAAMSTPRVGAVAVVLASGDVLVAGGVDGSGAPLSSAELFDPTTDSWSAAAPMPSAREFAAAAVLPDGAVLVAGGVGDGHAELATAIAYHPGSNTWTSVAAMGTARSFAAAAGLGDGRVLVAGGMGAGGPLATAEIFDPATGAWSPTVPMATACAMGQAVLLSGGDVLVAGDAPDAQLYDPSSGTWSLTDAAGSPTGTFLDLVPLPGGGALAVGGDVAGSGSSAAEVYDAGSNQWASAGALPSPLMAAAAVELGNGEVLVAGGAQGTLSSSARDITPEAGSELYSTTAHPAAASVSRPVPSPGSPWPWVGIGALVLILAAAAAAFRRRLPGLRGRA